MHAAQFSKTIAPPRRDSSLSDAGAPTREPQRATEYSAPSGVCLVQVGKFCETPLSDLDYPPGKSRGGDVESYSGNRIAVELAPSAGEQTARLASAQAKCAGDQSRQVNLAVAVGDVVGKVHGRY